MSERTEAITRIYDAVERRDEAELKASVAHDIEWVLPASLPWDGVRHGPGGALTILDRFEACFDGVWAEPDEFIEAENLLIVLGRVRGRARGTGREFEAPFAHVCTIDGTPSRLREYLDSAPIAAALAEPD